MFDFLKKHIFFIISLVAVIIILAVWEVAALIIALPIVLPTFSSVFIALLNLFASGETYLTILFTLIRCLIGYLIAFILGVIIGISAGRVKEFAAFMSPIVTVMKSVPVVAVTLIISVWISSYVLPVIVGFILVFPVIYTQIKTATENIDPTLIDVMKDMGGGFCKDFFRIYVPMILPYGLAGISATFGMNVKAVISAELLAYAKGSIGYAIYYAKADFLNEMPALFAWAAIAILLSAIFEIVLKIIFDKVCKRFSWL